MNAGGNKAALTREAANTWRLGCYEYICSSTTAAAPAHVTMPSLYIDLMSQPSRACYILCK